jgi:O-antigen ligase
MARDPYRVVLFGLIVMTVSRIHMQFPAFAKLRPALILTIVGVLLALSKPQLLSKQPLLHTKPAKYMAGFAILGIASMFFGISFGHTAVFILNVYIKTLVFAALVILAVRGPRDLYTLVWAYVISAALLAYTSLFVFHLQQYHGVQGIDFSRLAALATYDANDAGLVMLVGIPLALLLTETSGIRTKLFCLLLVGGIAAAIAKTGSRGAFLGLVSDGVALLLLVQAPLVRKVGVIAVAIFGLAVFAPPGYWDEISTISNPKADYNWSSKDGRRQLMIRGFGYMAQYPLFGLGMSNFAKAECEISEKALFHAENTGLRCTPPHNAYVETGAEEGVPGLILWILTIPGSVVSLVLLRRRLPKTWARGDPEERFLTKATTYFAASMAGYSVGSFFLTFAWTDITYYVVALNAGLYLAVEEKRRRNAMVLRAAAAGGAPVAQPVPAAGGRRPRRRA